MILSNAARLKPEIRLAQAISQFEASLPTAQKIDFRQEKAKSLKKAPDTCDAHYKETSLPWTTLHELPQ
jgi:hypothetical protein